jgi:branched-subunit amino acid transport protein
MISETTFMSVMVAIGLGTFAFRMSFIQASDQLRLPPLFEHALRYVPAAVLAALIVPQVSRVGGGAIDLSNIKVPIMLVAGLVAWYTRNVLLTLVVGMGLMWGSRFLFP